MVIRVDYSLREQDILEFFEYHLLQSPSYARRLWRERFLVPLIFVAIGVFLYRVQGTPIYLVAFLITAVAWIFWWPGYAKRRYRQNSQRMFSEGANRALLGSHKLIAEEDGIRVFSSAGDESMTRWSSLERIVVREGQIYLYHSAVHALIVPRDGVIAGDFEELARECKKRAA